MQRNDFFSNKFLLKAFEAHTWVARLSDFSSISDFKKILSASEKDKVNRYRFEKDRKRALVSRGILRMLLGSYLGTDPEKIEFSCNPFDKPFLKYPKRFRCLNFNYSHSGDCIVYAFGWDREIGIDVEYIDPSFSTQEIAEQYFSSNEISSFKMLPKELYTKAFLVVGLEKRHL